MWGIYYGEREYNLINKKGVLQKWRSFWTLLFVEYPAMLSEHSTEYLSRSIHMSIWVSFAVRLITLDCEFYTHRIGHCKIIITFCLHFSFSHALARVAIFQVVVFFFFCNPSVVASIDFSSLQPVCAVCILNSIQIQILLPVQYENLLKCKLQPLEFEIKIGCGACADHF